MKPSRKNILKRFERQKRINRLSEPGPHSFILVLDRLKPSFNIGKIFRSADAFGASEVCLIGIDSFDPAPAKGSFKWVPASFFNSFDSCYRYLLEKDYQIFLLDPKGSQLLPHAELPERCAFVFGHEEFGFSFAPEQYKGLSSVALPQFGKVQSLNVSVAASLVMYEFVRRKMTVSSANPE